MFRFTLEVLSRANLAVVHWSFEPLSRAGLKEEQLYECRQ